MVSLHYYGLSNYLMVVVCMITFEVNNEQTEVHSINPQFLALVKQHIRYRLVGKYFSRQSLCHGRCTCVQKTWKDRDGKLALLCATTSLMDEFLREAMRWCCDSKV